LNIILDIYIFFRFGTNVNDFILNWEPVNIDVPAFSENSEFYARDVWTDGTDYYYDRYDLG
jgi:hypothetical protein